jgi:hypothetical protein
LWKKGKPKALKETLFQAKHWWIFLWKKGKPKALKETLFQAKHWWTLIILPFIDSFF